MGTGRARSTLWAVLPMNSLFFLRQAGRAHDHDLALVPVEVVDRFLNGAPMGHFDGDVVPVREPVRGRGEDGIGVDVRRVDVFAAVPFGVEFHEGNQPQRDPAAFGGFDRDVDRRLRAGALAHREGQPRDRLRAVVAPGCQRHRNGRGVEQGVGRAADGVALEQPGAGGAHDDQAGLVFQGRIDEAGGVRVGLADVEPGLDVLGDEGQALPFRGEHLLLRGADTGFPPGSSRRRGFSGPQRRPGQGARPGRGPGRRPSATASAPRSLGV